MTTFAKSHPAPQPVAAGALSKEAQQMVLCRLGRQTVFPFPAGASKTQLSKRLGTFATFIFPVGSEKCSCVEKYEGTTLLHSQIVCNQTRRFSLHVEALERVFVISNIYSHPLIQKDEILAGHGLVSFAGTPIRSADGKIIGTLCSVDTKVRSWSDKEIKSLKEIATQIEDCQLW